MILSNTVTSISVDDFIARYGDDERYELIDGELIDRKPTDPHEQVGATVSRKLNVEAVFETGKRSRVCGRAALLY